MEAVGEPPTTREPYTNEKPEEFLLNGSGQLRVDRSKNTGNIQKYILLGLSPLSQSQCRAYRPS